MTRVFGEVLGSEDDGSFVFAGEGGKLGAGFGGGRTGFLFDDDEVVVFEEGVVRGELGGSHEGEVFGGEDGGEEGAGGVAFFVGGGGVVGAREGSSAGAGDGVGEEVVLGKWELGWRAGDHDSVLGYA